MLPQTQKNILAETALEGFAGDLPVIEGDAEGATPAMVQGLVRQDLVGFVTLPRDEDHVLPFG